MGKGTGGVVDVVLGRRYTRNPESPPPSEGQSQIVFFFFRLVKFLSNTLEPFSYFFFFLNFLNMAFSFLHVYSFLASEGLALKRVHCHELHWVVSRVTPVTLL